MNRTRIHCLHSAEFEYIPRANRILSYVSEAVGMLDKPGGDLLAVAMMIRRPRRDQIMGLLIERTRRCHCPQIALKYLQKTVKNRAATAHQRDVPNP
jgi:hypothetical protein